MHSAVSLQSEAKLKNDDGTVWEVVFGKSNPELYEEYKDRMLEMQEEIKKKKYENWYIHYYHGVQI